jgi:hypothetical protein
MGMNSPPSGHAMPLASAQRRAMPIGQRIGIGDGRSHREHRTAGNSADENVIGPAGPHREAEADATAAAKPAADDDQAAGDEPR